MVFPEDLLTSSALTSAVARFLFGKSASSSAVSPASLRTSASSTATALSSFSLSPHSCSKISSVSRFLGLDRVFHLRLLHVLDLAYKLRFRLPLLISAAYATCQLIDIWVPIVDFQVEEAEDDDDVSEDEYEDDEVEESGGEGEDDPAGGGQLLDLDEDGHPLRTPALQTRQMQPSHRR